MPPPNSTPSTLIVGGGTFGTSTAYHLSLAGYRNITVLDRFALPSTEAAGNDINKIVRTEYPEPLYTSLARDSREIWRDQKGLFAGLYHGTGWIIGASERSRGFVEGSIKSAKALNVQPPKLLSTKEVHEKWPVMNGGFEGWECYWSGDAAWVNAREGIVRMAREAMGNGVRYISGDGGYAKMLLFDDKGACVGVKTADGTAHFADRVVLAAGAAAGSLLDLEGQIVAKGHVVGHIQLTEGEVEEYKSMPILDHLEGGILFPPNEEGIMKIGAVHFVTNYAKESNGISLPRYRSDNPKDTIPAPVEARLRKWMETCVPELAHREWVETRICWDGDMPDYHFLITPHPKHRNLTLAIGGSAHGFKFLPVLGKYIVQSIEGILDPEIAHKWRWRPGTKLADYSTNPHPQKPEDLSEFPEWGKSML